MGTYYRALPNFCPDRPSHAVALAGGWCWFTDVATITRDQTEQIVPATDIPADVYHRLTSPRADILGLSLNHPQIMGILNVTPDSFSDGGQFYDPSVAVGHAMAMIRDGASIIDIGGESTRPGARTVEISAEIDRTAPVIAALRAQNNVAISIDTRKAEVARAAIKAGASLVNDVSAFTYDPQLAQVTAEATLPVCLMHAQGDPATMQQDPQYDNVLLDVYDFLEARIKVAETAGIPRDQIIVDPGIGFGKTLEHNLALLRGLSLFHALGCPILLGASRKRFIGTIGGGQTAADRMAGSVAVALDAVRQGVQILRVHDTFATKQALDLMMTINRVEPT